jgi:hypothetical protein
MDREAITSDLNDDRRVLAFFWRFRKRQHLFLAVLHNNTHASDSRRTQRLNFSGVPRRCELSRYRYELTAHSPSPATYCLSHCVGLRYATNQTSPRPFLQSLTGVRITSGEPNKSHFELRCRLVNAARQICWRNGQDLRKGASPKGTHRQGSRPEWCDRARWSRNSQPLTQGRTFG